MVLSADEQRLLDCVDDARVLADLATLVAIPSVDGTPSESVAQAWCADRLAGIGRDVDSWAIDVPALADDPAFPGMEVARTEAVGCVGVLGESARPSAPEAAPVPALILNGHVDVVPPGPADRWPESGPFAARTEDGAIWGRGTCDMKGGVAAVLGAVAAIVESGLPLARPLAVHTVVGEEDGGLGTYATLRRGHRGDACVIAEPTTGAIIPANAGALTFRLEITGLATHGSTRTRGVSAIDKLEVISAALRALERDRNRHDDPRFTHLDLPWPLSIGMLRAGDWASTVPDQLVAEGRYGVRPGESLEAARAGFEVAVGQACRTDPWLADHPVAVSWPGGAFASGATPVGHRLVGDLRGVITDLGSPEPPVRGAPYGSDLRQYTGAGIPCVQYGPGDVRYAHATDEHVPIADLLHCARSYALLSYRACRA